MANRGEDPKLFEIFLAVLQTVATIVGTLIAWAAFSAGGAPPLQAPSFQEIQSDLSTVIRPTAVVRLLRA